MKFFLIILSFLLFTNCSFTNTKLATKEYGNNIETSSIVTVKPKIIKRVLLKTFICLTI